MEDKKIDPALLQAGKMSRAIDCIRTALNEEDHIDFGRACTELLRAKILYDREIEERAKNA